VLPQINRLKNKKDFERVFKQGKGYRGDFLFCKLIINKSKRSRFGIVVTEKVSKKAVIRNRIKRRLREILRLNLPKIKQGIDVVIVACSGIENKNFWEIERDINKIFIEADVYKS